MNISEKLAPKLRMLREVHNYTQDYVASILDISPNTYSLMEKGQATFSIDRIEKLAQLYKMDIGDFLRINDQTIIHHITHSNGICSENVNIHHNGLADEERQMYKDTIARLEEQNNKLMILIDKLSDRLS
ncbi:helix-turn-helix domain-containing protein [Taibaiella lutea]|uniref:Helix-turn-helix domain-containing protein n=1 Tax=Taibaiella lutea TaxID=2608001 RepID=A0A5M6CMI2_9BACT|nr:helix-turn-helix domain-containing protein [Taibaiella lutea]KAA5536227.1 helix-turn-helix domain-containing protein [Taibaiella lutea]